MLIDSKKIIILMIINVVMVTILAYTSFGLNMKTVVYPAGLLPGIYGFNTWYIYHHIDNSIKAAVKTSLALFVLHGIIVLLVLVVS